MAILQLDPILYVLRARVLVVTLLFTIFGQALTKLLKIDEMAAYYESLAPLLALVISLLISLFIKGRKTKTLARNIKIAAGVMFVCLLVAVGFYTQLFIKSTFKFKGFDSNTVSYYVKGSKDAYSASALEFKKKHPVITSDDDLIREGFGGPEHKSKAWTEDSIQQNLLNLILGYCMVVMLFAGIISLLCESLYVAKRSPQKKKKEVVTPV
ncbi:hypothetical protein GFS24_15990 [Chitinophaga sp. SYP-B3965]|uniref:hypothetical protein n=1 Tax=Chitinophaga sp. SYP-B3965 TaxID=2663120 RepID=UPI00129A071C|nr:hypothetical protein [Chitinophaga sp. SYP-B3965]MRG46625.1 hypothetical protein [Chitinophaga sp. SYP-B3965]